MYDFDRIVKAAESCDFHGEFASDIKHCDVRTKYKPGLLNPFKGTSLYIKS